MLEFQPLRLEHIQLVAPYLYMGNSRLCDRSIGAIFLWRGYYNTHFAIHEGGLYLRLVSPENGGLVFLPPFGGNSARYQPLIAYCEQEEQPLHLAIVPKEELPAVLEVFPGSAVHSERDWCDYLYESAPMQSFPGKRYHGQRNHVNRFLKQYPDWQFAEINSTNLELVEQFARKHYAQLEKKTPSLEEEFHKTIELLQNYAAYRQVGGVLFAQDSVAGFSIGEVVNDTLIIHLEKAKRDIFGAYPMLVSQFATRYALEGVNFINREEDIGDEGLRTSKLSYHPVELLEKFLVIVS